MFSYICKALVLVAILHQAVGYQEDIVEWNDFVDGKVPPYSVFAGESDEGVHVFVGLAHVSNGANEGYIPTSIRAGIPSVNVSLDDDTIITVHENIKVLCMRGPYQQRKLGWEYTSQEDFQSQFENKQFRPLLVGWQEGVSGSATFNASIYVGKGPAGQFGENFVGKVYHNHPDSLVNNKLITPGWNSKAWGWTSKVWSYYNYNTLVYYLY